MPIVKKCKTEACCGPKHHHENSEASLRVLGKITRRLICYRGMSSGVQKGRWELVGMILAKTACKWKGKLWQIANLFLLLTLRRTVNSSIMFNEPKNLCNSSISWDSVGVRLQ
ncbi:hypothetical protein FF1_001870 [Malus domestica]